MSGILVALEELEAAALAYAITETDNSLTRLRVAARFYREAHERQSGTAGGLSSSVDLPSSTGMQPEFIEEVRNVHPIFDSTVGRPW